MQNIKILEHDGFGTETDAVTSDVFVSIRSNLSTTSDLDSQPVSAPIKVAIIDKKFDLNGDDKISLADVGVFFTAMVRNDIRADFNNDGKVNLADLSMLMSALGTSIPE